MLFEIQYKRLALPSRTNGRAVTFAPAYSDQQLALLGGRIKEALGEQFKEFKALDGAQTHDITIRWAELDLAAEVAKIDGIIKVWLSEQKGRA